MSCCLRGQTASSVLYIPRLNEAAVDLQTDSAPIPLRKVSVSSLSPTVALALCPRVRPRRHRRAYPTRRPRPRLARTPRTGGQRPGAHEPGAHRRHSTGGGFPSALTRSRSVTGRHSWRTANGRTQGRLTRAPGTAADHRSLAVGTQGRWPRRRQRLGRFELGLGRLPSSTLGVGEDGGLVEEGPDAVELGAGGGV